MASVKINPWYCLKKNRIVPLEHITLLHLKRSNGLKIIIFSPKWPFRLMMTPAGFFFSCGPNNWTTNIKFQNDVKSLIFFSEEDLFPTLLNDYLFKIKKYFSRKSKTIPKLVISERRGNQNFTEQSKQQQKNNLIKINFLAEMATKFLEGRGLLSMKKLGQLCNIFQLSILAIRAYCYGEIPHICTKLVCCFN